MTTNREKINIKFQELSLKIDPNKDLGISAKDIAEELNIQRNLVSHFLNEFVNEGNAIKVNTRPVYFLSRSVYENDKDSYLMINQYLKQGIENKNTENKNINPFSQLVGSEGSLKTIIDQCKSSVIYPPKGLTSLFVGESGVGKSLFARLTYKYALKSEYCTGDFIELNCAEYANNPELLSSILFGHAKGAYTGADQEKKGLIELADNGYLFLDEIHRLPSEGQEKLFLFMDKGHFRRMGETDKYRKSNVRLMFATTENPESHFVDTFLRRIPLIIKIPSYKERPQNERLDLIYNFYRKEASLIKKNMIIKNNVINLLLNNIEKGNVGKLSNIIKLSCAKALTEEKINTGETIFIQINHLPENLLKLSEINEENPFNVNDLEISYINSKETNQRTGEKLRLQRYNQIIVSRIMALKKNEIDEDTFYIKICRIFNSCINHVMFDLNMHKQNIFFESMQKTIRNILSYAYLNFGLNQYNSHVGILTNLVLYIYENVESLVLNKELTEAIEEFGSRYHKELKIAKVILDELEREVSIPNKKIFILYLFMFVYSQQRTLKKRNINAIIIAHGYSTAASIASTSNRLLGSYVYESFDMPLTATIDDINNEIIKYCQTIDIENDLVILVDMGSLEKIYTKLSGHYSGNIAIINNVSTAIALDVGQRILNDESIESIADHSVKKIHISSRVIQKKSKKKAIVTTCTTRLGAAKMIKKLIDENTENKIPIFTIDYYELKNKGVNQSLLQDYSVEMIIGTEDPEVKDVPFLSFETFINRKSSDSLLKKAFPDIFSDRILDSINKDMVKMFTLENIVDYLTILNPRQTINQVEDAVVKIERSFGVKMDGFLKISLYIHISCMMERVIIKNPNLNYPELDNFVQYHVHFIKTIKNAFSVIEQYYNIEIPFSEIGFIYDIMKNRIEIGNS